jgi:transposase
MSRVPRVFTGEFRVAVAQRIAAGESVSKLRRELDIRRSVLYRWRSRYREEGAAGLQLTVGGQSSHAATARPVNAGITEEERLRQQVAELERKIGQQSMQLDFFKRAFKRVKGSRQSSKNSGETASTTKSA